MSIETNISAGAGHIGYYGKHIVTIDKTCKTCFEYMQRGYRESGTYTVYPPSHPEGILVYCDMETDGGGWTLVWSNRRGTSNKPVTSITWDRAVGVDTFTNGRPCGCGDDYDFYAGLGLWNEFMEGETGGELRYQWIDPSTKYTMQDAKFNIRKFSPDDMYTLHLSDKVNLVGGIDPGIWTYHNERKFTTYDRDNDPYSANCSRSYSNTPWWYGQCWDGHICGGGELGGNYGNGAFWRSSSNNGSYANGDGYGDGKIWIR